MGEFAFEVGEAVEVIDNGAFWTTHDSLAHDLGLTLWNRGVNPYNGGLYRIISRGASGSPRSRNAYAIESQTGVQYLIGEFGLGPIVVLGAQFPCSVDEEEYDG